MLTFVLYCIYHSSNYCVWISLSNLCFSGVPVTTRATDQPDPPPRPHTRNNRRFPATPALRARMVDFYNLLKGKEDDEAADEASFQDLIEMGNSDAAGFFKSLVRLHFSESFRSLQARTHVSQFVRALTSDSPVISYLPIPIARLFHAVMRRPGKVFLVEEVDDMQQDAPLVYKLLSAIACGSPVRDVPLTCVQLFCTLIRISILCGTGPGAGECFENPLPPSSGTNECLLSGICCGLPRVRNRPPCQMDRIKNDENEDNVLPGCQHGFKSGRSRTGGVFTFFCEHGVCLAFFILPNAEGRDEAYSFIVSYFVLAPEIIIYDFGCSLEEYCLNRSPDFFKNTRNFIDRFHMPNHKACADSYNLSNYMHLDFVNSEVAEQCNSVLQKVKPRLSQMSQVSFMLTMRLVLEAWNERKLQKIERMNLHVSTVENGLH